MPNPKCSIPNAQSRVLLLAIALTVAGCGSSAPAPAATPDTPQKAAAQAVAEMQSGEPVKFESLQALMPEVAGWDKGEATGMSLSVPFKGAQASLTLKKGDAEISIEIVDTVFNQMMYAPLALYLSAGFSTSDENGYKKGLTISGQPAFEEWDKNAKTGSVTMIVGRRFFVHVQNTGADSTELAKSVAATIDTAKLAALK